MDSEYMCAYIYKKKKRTLVTMTVNVSCATINSLYLNMMNGIFIITKIGQSIHCQHSTNRNAAFKFSKHCVYMSTQTRPSPVFLIT